MNRAHQLPRITIHKLLRQAGIYTLVIIGALFIGFPFFQMIMTSFKDIG